MNQLPRIFIAYARKDAPLLAKLRVYLSPLQRRQQCHIFFDGEIAPGEQWDKRLKDELHAANIFVLLVSPEFLNSDYIHETELPKALARWRDGTAKVVPVILRDCLWEMTELEELQVVLKDGLPIDRQDAYAHAAREISRVVKNYNADLRQAVEETEARLRKDAEEISKRKATDERRRKEEEVESQRLSTLDPFHDLMVKIEGGVFRMGSNKLGEEKPIHVVNMDNFHLCRCPVTQMQWQIVMGNNPSQFQYCNDCPVEQVTWLEVQEFLKRLNQKSGKNYRLPTEAEWEFAARGGNQNMGFEYSGSNNLDEVGWFIENSGNVTHPVGQKKSNELGLFDMSGNVWEWCEDDWHDNYSGAPDDGFSWVNTPKRGANRVLRGGSFFLDADYCRSTSRGYDLAGTRYDNFGFRLCLSSHSIY